MLETKQGAMCISKVQVTKFRERFWVHPNLLFHHMDFRCPPSTLDCFLNGSRHSQWPVPVLNSFPTNKFNIRVTISLLYLTGDTYRVTKITPSELPKSKEAKEHPCSLKASHEKKDSHMT
jgi:hypothetical protein